MRSTSIYRWNANSIQKENEINLRAGEIALADIDADGKLDMLFKKYGDSIRIYQHGEGKCLVKAELTKSSEWRGFGRSASDARLKGLGPGATSSRSQWDTSVSPIIKTTFQHYDILDYNDDSYSDIAVCGMGGVQIISNRARKEFQAAGFVDDISGFGPHLRVCDIDHDGSADVVVSAKDQIIGLGVGEDGSLERKCTAGDESGAQSGFTWPPAAWSLSSHEILRYRRGRKGRAGNA